MGLMSCRSTGLLKITSSKSGFNYRQSRSSYGRSLQTPRTPVLRSLLPTNCSTVSAECCQNSAKTASFRLFLDWVAISPVNMGRPMQGYSEEKEYDWSILPTRRRFRRSETGLAADRAASEALQAKEPERFRAKRLQI
jgi:hypothetical protein